MKVGKLFIITGPSGVGKGTILKEIDLSKEYNIHFSISATTRKIRSGEKNGVNYYFLKRQDFIEGIEKGKFLEWVEYAGNYYGTLKSEIDKNLETGKNVLLEIEPIGMRNISKIYPNCISVFISPPNIKELENRLKKRLTESDEDISKRLNIAKQEIKDSTQYTHIIVNKDVEFAIEELRSLFSKYLNE